jgi:SH3 domain protein
MFYFRSQLKGFYAMRSVSGVFIQLIVLIFMITPIKNVLAQETTSAAQANEKKAYIIDDLSIFMRSGAGPQYRLLGTITAGTQVNIVDEPKNDFQKIIDDKGRTGWIEVKYLQQKPGLRYVIAELNAQLASKDEQIAQLHNTVSENEQKIAKLVSSNQQLSKQLTTMTKKYNETQKALDQHDTTVQKQWFFNGAIVLGIGLILGLILPRLGHRRANLNSWK